MNNRPYLAGEIEPVLNKGFIGSSPQSMEPVANRVPSRKPLPAKDAASSSNSGTGRQRADRDSHYSGRSMRASPSTAPQSCYGLPPGLSKFYGPAPGITTPMSYQKQHQTGRSVLHRSKDRTSYENSGLDSRDNKSIRKGDCEGSNAPTHGPVVNKRNDYADLASFPSGVSSLQNKYNRPEFQRQVSNGGSISHRSKDSIWNGNSGFASRDKSVRDSDCEGPSELTRGPRFSKRNDSVASSSLPPPVSALGDEYNVVDFQTEYENAKFYVIKSYSEDDVQKCIKYKVWASTPIGNKKLDAAFHDAKLKVSESGKCLVFLFFSVNTSGQFLGLAEMTGKVDFNKTMDFWQVDKWSGFFLVKWHIIKDIPNTQLRHILLEHNENKPVTFTRDTQEIGLKEGLQMLKIFKDYPAKSSILDDYYFYEDREEAIQDRKSRMPATHRTNGP